MTCQRLCGEWDTEKKRLMSKWYKKATLAHDLTFVVTTWLRNAINNQDPASLNDDVSFQMGGADNEAELSAAITTATSIVSTEQGGQLSPSQHELIRSLQSRVGSMQQPDDLGVQPMQPMKPMSPQSPIGSLEQPMNDQPAQF